MCLLWKHAFLIIFLKPSFYVCHKMKIYDNDHHNVRLSSYWFACKKKIILNHERPVEVNDSTNQKCVTLIRLWWTKIRLDHHNNVQILTTGAPRNFTALRLYTHCFWKIWQNEIKSKGNIFTWSIVRLVRLFRWFSTSHFW